MECRIFREAPYEEMLRLQTEEFERRVECRKEGIQLPEDLIFFVEHLPVYTIGKHGDFSNLIVDRLSLERNNIKLFHIGRGGDITYHGPGQLTVYPILDMRRYRLGVKEYVALLEEAVIQTIGAYGIKGERIDGATGVWIKDEKGERKISAIGVKCNRYVTMHGLSLNVSSDVSGFTRINPCGFQDKGVTSISIERGIETDFSEVIEKLRSCLTDLLRLRIASQGNS